MRTVVTDVQVKCSVGPSQADIVCSARTLRERGTGQCSTFACKFPLELGTVEELGTVDDLCPDKLNVICQVLVSWFAIRVFASGNGNAPWAVTTNAGGSGKSEGGLRRSRSPIGTLTVSITATTIICKLLILRIYCNANAICQWNNSRSLISTANFVFNLKLTDQF